MAQTRQGNASVVNGSATVNGTGTLWLSEVSATDQFTIEGDGVSYQIASVISDTQLTLSSPYAGVTASNENYTIHRDFTSNLNLPLPFASDVEVATKIREAFEILDFTGGAGGGTLAGLGDVDLAGLNDGDGLVYNLSTGNWEPAALGSGGPFSINDATDVTITTPVAGQVLIYNGADFINAFLLLNQLGDVDLTGAVDGDALVLSSGTWIPQAVSGGGGSGEANTVTNLGAGEGTFSQKVGVDLQFKSIVAGSNISLVSTSDEITISTAAAGEDNTASNLGVGEGVFAQKVSEDLQFKSIVAGSNITINSNGDEITINGTAAGASSFSALSDTPNSYASAGEDFVRVNSAENGLEFFPNPGYITSTLQQTLNLNGNDFRTNEDLILEFVDVGDPNRVFQLLHPAVTAEAGGSTSLLITEEGDNSSANIFMRARDLTGANSRLFSIVHEGNAGSAGRTQFQADGDIELVPTGTVNIKGLIYPSADGTSGQVIATDGSNNLGFVDVIPEAPQDGTPYARQDATWVSAAGGVPGGSNTEIQFNDSGSFGGSDQLTTFNDSGGGYNNRRVLRVASDTGSELRLVRTTGSSNPMALTFHGAEEGSEGVNDWLGTIHYNDSVDLLLIATNSTGPQKNIRINPQAGDLQLYPGNGKNVYINAGGNEYSLPNDRGSTGDVLTSDGLGGTSWAPVSSGGGLSAVVDDPTPQLGGNLDMAGNRIVDEQIINFEFTNTQSNVFTSAFSILQPNNGDPLSNTQLIVADQNPSARPEIALQADSGVDAIQGRLILTDSDTFELQSDQQIVISHNSGSSKIELDGLIANVNGLEVQESGTFTTTNDTPQNIATIEIPTDEQRFITARTRGFESATNSMYWRYIRVGAKNVGGTVSLVGGVASDSGYDAGASAWDISVVVSGPNVLIQVTGEAGKTIDWETLPEVS